MRLLNLGCGDTFHPEWVNVDLAPAAPGVMACDLRRPLPFADGHFDAVYHSHVLEHLPADEAERFLREALRVLRPGGIMRVVVPDLEQIARLYLQTLAAAEHGDPGAEPNHLWMTLELYDQTVRARSGGGMKAYLQRPQVANLDFVRSRIGGDADAIRSASSRRPSLLSALGRKRAPEWARLVRRQVTRSIVRVVGGASTLAAFDEGIFRHGGEVHRWMYDGLSLRRLLERAGAREVRRCDAFRSAIPAFARYQLDAIDGVVRKPDSMFMEAMRPE